MPFLGSVFEKNVSFFSTAFDIESLVFLKELGLSMVKIPSGEITNLPYLRKAAYNNIRFVIEQFDSNLESFKRKYIQNGRTESTGNCNRDKLVSPTPIVIRLIFHTSEIFSKISLAVDFVSSKAKNKCSTEINSSFIFIASWRARSKTFAMSCVK